MTLSTIQPNRRHFLSASVSLAAAPLIWTPSSRTPIPANERVSVGVIGLGSRGFNLINDLLKCEDVEIIALCDVHELHYRDGTWGQGRSYGRLPARDLIQKHNARLERKRASSGPQLYADYRDVVAREDLDALVIATPDHWHALCTLEGITAGKDIYCEKPLTHLFAEGQAVVSAVAKQNTVFQTGSQQRSDARFRRAAEIVRNGHLGRVHAVEVGLPPGYAEPQGDTQITAPPAKLDYEMWCGPAPKLPYMRARHHRWWRGHRAFGGGVLMDWIGHHNDIAHWALGWDHSGPEKVEAVQWQFPPTQVYDTPRHYEIRCVYPGDVQSSISSQHPLGTRFIGEDGWLFVSRSKLEASTPDWLRPDFAIGERRLERSPGHMRNFIDCVKSRQTCISPASITHRSITPGHLGYVSQSLGRAIRWDPQRELVLHDEEADRLLRTVKYRSPWEWNAIAGQP